jgi:predicted signal transduction protein with EAL and GGDEF domain
LHTCAPVSFAAAPAPSSETLRCLRDIGIRISIDDFDTAHSSLAQPQNLAVHKLEIDSSFIMNRGVARRA